MHRFVIADHIRTREIVAEAARYASDSKEWDFSITFRGDGSYTEHMSERAGIVGDFDIRSDGRGGFFFEASPFSDHQDALHHQGGWWHL